MKRLLIVLALLLLLAACEDVTAPMQEYEGCVHAVLADGSETCL